MSDKNIIILLINWYINNFVLEIHPNYITKNPFAISGNGGEKNKINLTKN